MRRAPQLSPFVPGMLYFAVIRHRWAARQDGAGKEKKEKDQ